MICVCMIWMGVYDMAMVHYHEHVEAKVEQCVPPLLRTRLCSEVAPTLVTQISAPHVGANMTGASRSTRVYVSRSHRCTVVTSGM